MKTKILEYGDKEIKHLKKVDVLLGKEINKIGKIERVIIPDLFQALVYAIIGQQISLKAVHTVWKKTIETLGEITPENIINKTVEEISACGMSSRKASYILGIANAIIDKELDLDKFYSMSDDEIIKTLVLLKGIGKWTAEMILLNSMERPDIISYDDIAIRRGMMILYGLDEITKEEFLKYRERYSPYASIASIYLWRISYNYSKVGDK
ncbi:MAG TPA: DNA-3-methyladenine glycosylase 2 family protein [Clostridiales bacterium]|nr:DNA-3-methyladenine glycosylase 2 family protein [Clostridiales bacterium]